MCVCVCVCVCVSTRQRTCVHVVAHMYEFMGNGVTPVQTGEAQVRRCGLLTVGPAVVSGGQLKGNGKLQEFIGREVCTSTKQTHF